MGESLLNQLTASGVPLIEIVVRFYKKATQEFNALGEDIHLSEGDWYYKPNLRVGDASAESQLRLFGWKVHRVPLTLQNQETGEFEESDIYRWEDLEPQNCMPSAMRGVVEGISYSQPGSNDQGQWYEPKLS